MLSGIDGGIGIGSDEDTEVFVSEGSSDSLLTAGWIDWSLIESRKVILPDCQSINGLKRRSQLKPSTRLQLESSGVT